MKIAVINNIKNENKVKALIERLSKDKKITIKIIDNINTLNRNYDVYILITNSIKDVLNLKNIIESCNKIVIITSNSNVKFVMCSIEVTTNLIHLNTDIDIIIEKINNMQI